MEWTDQQILDTLRMIEASGYDEVRIETAGFKLHVRKTGAPAALDAPAAGSTAPQPTVATTTPVTAAAPVQPIPVAQPAATAHAAEAPPPGVIVVRAPMIGTFYRAPAPASPPFTEVGATVTSDDTVCLIEVMKLFNTIKAGTAGKVVRVLAQNAATVQKDEALLWIEPAAR